VISLKSLNRRYLLSNAASLADTFDLDLEIATFPSLQLHDPALLLFKRSRVGKPGARFQSGHIAICF
jgi:hypothetical protein